MTAAARAETTDNELEEMKKRLADQEREIAEANARAADAESKVRGEQTNRFAAQEAALDSTLVASKQKLKEAKAGWAKAMGDGNYIEAAEFQDQMSDIKQEITALNWQKDQIARAKSAPVATTEAERFEVAIKALPAPAQQWCRLHPEYVTDNKKNALAQAAHFKAVGNEIKEWTPEYWEFVEKELGLRKGARTKSEEPIEGDEEVDEDRALEAMLEGEEEEVIEDEPIDNEVGPDTRRNAPGYRDEKPPPGRDVRRASPTRAAPTPREPVRERSTSTAAPPSRGAGAGGSTTRTTKRQPTKGEVEAAKISFPDEWKKSPSEALKLYFENQTALRREGRL